LTLRDRDLVSVQEARELVLRAAEAQKKFAAFSQQQVDAVVEAMAKAAEDESERLARVAVEETGYGNVPDKMLKNKLAWEEVPRAIRGMRTVGIVREDAEKKILEVATPVGVVAAVIPSTNPTSTTIYKTIISLKARNAIVLSPHPTAVRCITETANVLIRAAQAAGAPEDLILCAANPTLQGTQELMRQRGIGVILATGGTGLVRAAYSSGKPAFGVGPGNVPAYIERTAIIAKAVADVFAGKTFDYGTICSSEQSIVCDEAIREKVLEECAQQGAYFLTPEEIARLGELVIVAATHTPNPKIVGRPATMIAEMAGIKVPPMTRVLIAKLDSVGKEHPLSAEKLSPILAFYSVPDTSAAIELCTRLLRFGGLGHTIAVHSQSDAAIRQFGGAVPAFRVCVNTSAVHGSVGYSTNLFPAMTLGCGALGGNITSDNIGPQHLMNIKRIAWESRSVAHRTIPAERRLELEAPATKPVQIAAAAVAKGSSVAPGSAADGPPASPAPPAPSPERALIAKVVEQVMSAHGIARGSGVPPVAASRPAGTAPAPAPAAPLPSPSEVAAAAVAAVLEKKRTPPAQTVCPAPSLAPSFKPLAPSSSAPNPSTLAPEIVPFVSETDVRQAITRGVKIHIGPKTIVTPSARDLAVAHEIFVESEM
jgi:acetaldehyde dehydrogenase (acetylating)